MIKIIFYIVAYLILFIMLTASIFRAADLLSSSMLNAVLLAGTIAWFSVMSLRHQIIDYCSTMVRSK